MYSTPFNIYCVTETWLSDSIFDHEILPCGYSLYRKDRATCGGGVLIAVSDLVPITLIPSPPDLEIIAVNLNCHNKPISLCTVYVPPNSSDSYRKCLLSYLHSFASHMETVIIVGDYNMPDICWSTLTGTSTFSNSFCDFMYEMNLTQLVMDSTHVKGNILDLVITNTENLISDISIADSHSLISSDHHRVSFKINYILPPSRGTSHKFFFDYSKADFVGLCDHLLDSDFGNCLLSSDVEFVWANIKSAILNAMDIYIPKVHLKPHKHPKWFTADIRHMLNCIRTLRRKCNNHPTYCNLSKLQSLENELQNKLTAAKCSYEKFLIETFSKENSSKIYRYISTLTSYGTIPPIVTLNSSTATSDGDKATMFNTFFHSVFTHSPFNLPPLEELPIPCSTITDISISESDVYNAFSLNTTKSMGIDRIGPKLLKHCALALYKPIHHLFVLSITHHYVPKDWRLHLITPIHKSGDKSSVKNYRPISLLCIISKVLEKIIYDKIIPFVSRAISSSQFGFRPKHSTLQQLLLFVNSVCESFCSKSQVDVVILRKLLTVFLIMNC